MTLAFTAAVSAQWDGYYCTSGNCGINYYNYNCGYNTTGYYCTGNYTQPYQASFVKDVTYADGAYVAPGQSFSKTWRIRNTGTYTWTTNMALVFVGGDQMGASPCVYLPYTSARVIMLISLSRWSLRRSRPMRWANGNSALRTVRFSVSAAMGRPQSGSRSTP